MSAEDQSVGWSRWYKRDQGYLTNFVKFRLYSSGRGALVDDIVQDSFERGFLNITTGRYIYQGISLRGYLCGIAKNLLSDAYRKSKKAVSYTHLTLPTILLV